MGKKILIVLVALGLLVAGAAFWFFHWFVGPSNPAAFLPANTLFYAALPDLIQTASRWNETSLAKISKEPDVKKFLEKPIQLFLGADQKSGNQIVEVLMDLKPNRIFLCAQNVSETEPQLAVGFQYWGGAGSFKRALEELTQSMSRGQSVAAHVETYGKFEIQNFDLPNGRLAAVSWKNWGFLANNSKAIKTILDSATQSDTPKLLQDETYRSTVTPLSVKPDFLVFLRVAPLLDALLEAGKRLGASAIPHQVNAVREARAIGFSTKLEGANIQDVCFVRMERPLVPAPPLTSQELEFTNEKSLGYFQFTIDWDRLKPDGNLASVSPASSNAFEVMEDLHQQAKAVFDKEAAIIVNWPSGVIRPQVGLILKGKDARQITAFIEQTLASFTGQASVIHDGGMSVYQFNTMGRGLVHPSIAVVDSYLVASLDLEDLQGILSSYREKTTLAKNPQFQKEAKLWKSANLGYGYLDSALLFGQTYQTVRPLLMLAGSLMPKQNAFVDLDALPEAKSIVSHLNPITYSQTSTEEGYRLESKGPITINQAIALGVWLGMESWDKLSSRFN